MNEAGALGAHARGPAPASSFAGERYSQAVARVDARCHNWPPRERAAHRADDAGQDARLGEVGSPLFGEGFA